MNLLNSRLGVFKSTLGLGIGGTLFAGYLTFYKAITGTCALGEGCPIVLGLPACVYGFVVFLAITLCSARAVFLGEAAWTRKALIGLSGFGIAFAGFLSATEIAQWIASGRSYAMVLPSCVYGLIFYVAVFVLALRLGRVAK